MSNFTFRCDACGAESSPSWWGHYWHGCLLTYCETHYNRSPENVPIDENTPRRLSFNHYPDCVKQPAGAEQ